MSGCAGIIEIDRRAPADNVEMLGRGRVRSGVLGVCAKSIGLAVNSSGQTEPNKSRESQVTKGREQNPSKGKQNDLHVPGTVVIMIKKCDQITSKNWEKIRDDRLYFGSKRNNTPADASRSRGYPEVSNSAPSRRAGCTAGSSKLVIDH